MNFKMTVATVALMSLSCGAPTSVPLRSRGESCVSSSECAGVLVCSFGTCSDSSGAGSGTMSSSNGCNPPCSGSQLCVNWDGNRTCMTKCTVDSQCPTCCRSTQTGEGVCAPVQSHCVGPTQSMCPSGQILVSWSGGTAVCSRLCASNSECSSGRCNTLSDGRQACAPGSSSGGSAGGGAGAGCRFDGNCLKWVNTLSPNGMPGCRPGESLLPVLENVCTRSVMCDICLPGRRECEKIVPFDPGQRRGGWAEFGWCTTDRRLEWYCAVDDPQSTKSMITCLRELRGGP
jgi:hypothetical protein